MVLTTAAVSELFTDAFNKKFGENGSGSVVAARRAGFEHFTAKGFPTQRDEEWKYTNVSELAKTNWQPQTNDLQSTIDDTDAEKLFTGFNIERNGFAALNQAFADVRIVRIAKDTSVAEPIEFNFSTGKNSAAFPRIIVIAESGSKATLVEKYNAGGNAFTNSAIQIIVEDNANLTHYRVQKDEQSSFHYGLTEVELGRGSNYNSTNINLGAKLSRHDISLKFTAEGAEAWVDGLYMLNENQHHDTHSSIDHAVPNCLSHQTYKGVLNDSSRAVFNGKVFVRLNASGTDAKQSNKNLLLSNDARIDTKPQLEIFNDDVKCTHGATVGQLEDEELFYLLTRGLPETLAKNLLTYGFAEEVINKIEIEDIKQDLDAIVLNRLGTEI